ncbi:hypothetical protein BC828DRAFT_388432 [Blastocladiella britannica]|nr:hypothetical protein BC828DRAFT_388432 [Blastocladiella britannica]
MSLPPLQSLPSPMVLALHARITHIAAHLAHAAGVSPAYAPAYAAASSTGPPTNAVAIQHHHHQHHQHHQQRQLWQYQSMPPPPPLPTLSDTFIHAAVAGAVALKQSPIPDAVTGALTAGIRSLQSLESTYGLKDKVISLGKAGVSKAVEVDRTYQVHEKVGTALLTSLSAVTQAAVAYKKAPSYADVMVTDGGSLPIIEGGPQQLLLQQGDGATVDPGPPPQPPSGQQQQQLLPPPPPLSSAALGSLYGGSEMMMMGGGSVPPPPATTAGLDGQVANGGRGAKLLGYLLP